MIAPVYREDGIVLYQCDARLVLPQLTLCSHLITDPPYSAHVHGNSRAGVGQGQGGSRPRELGFDSLSDELLVAVASWAARTVLRWSMIFADIDESLPLWRRALTRHGLEHVRTGIWVKKGAPPQFTGDRPAMGVEGIEIAHRPGKKRWNGGGKHAVWTYPIVRKDRLHPTEKPLGLMLDLVKMFTSEDEIIVDPFAGAGTTLVAAKALNRRAIGIEMDPDHVGHTISRLRTIERGQYVDPPVPAKESA